MDVRLEIERYSREEDKPALLWLYDKYKNSSSAYWSFVAECTFSRYGKHSYQVHRVWRPTVEGKILYMWDQIGELRGSA